MGAGMRGWGGAKTARLGDTETGSEASGECGMRAGPLIPRYSLPRRRAGRYPDRRPTCGGDGLGHLQRPRVDCRSLVNWVNTIFNNVHVPLAKWEL